MGCISNKKKYLIKTLELGKGYVDVETLETIIISTSFEESELFILLKIFISLKPNKDFKLTNHQLMEFKHFKYSPFGEHLLEAFGLKRTSPYTRPNRKSTQDDINEDQTNIENVRQHILILHEPSEDKKSIQEEDVQLDCDVFTVPHLFTSSNDDVPAIPFSMFCGIMKIFSQHASIDEKAKVYFNLFDFDNDGKISSKDLTQYFSNVHRDNDGHNESQLRNTVKSGSKANQSIEQRAVRETEVVQGLIVPSEHEGNAPRPKGDENNEEEDKKKEDKSPHNNQDANSNNIVLHKRKDSKKTTTKTKELSKDIEEDIKQIIHLIIKETASNNNECIDYLDFRNQLINTQFLLDYNNYIYLPDYK